MEPSPRPRFAIRALLFIMCPAIDLADTVIVSYSARSLKHSGNLVPIQAYSQPPVLPRDGLVPLSLLNVHAAAPRILVTMILKKQPRFVQNCQTARLAAHHFA